MSWWVDEFASWWVCELMSLRVDELMSWWVGEIVSWCIRELLVFREFTSKQVDLFCTPYMREASILCWQHKNNKPLSIYRNIKSQDGFYIKRQRCRGPGSALPGCIISFLYIKPQLFRVTMFPRGVVLYRFSTSNHNLAIAARWCVRVVLYRFSTSNHNTAHATRKM